MGLASCIFPGMGMGMGMGRRVYAGRRSPRACGVGFTLIELVICIGIIMILVGLIAPALGNAISRARLARDVALVRQQAAVIAMYSTDFRDTYPYPYDLTGHLFRVTGDWVLPMLDSGHVDSVSDMDPDVERGLAFSYFISAAMVYAADEMRPGAVPPMEEQASRAVRSQHVLFPSSKGLTVRLHDGMPTAPGQARAFCHDMYPPLWEAPMSFADGSATHGIVSDFIGGSPVYTEHGIGCPVYATWFGVRGRDR